jgi:hypothetical protein
MEKLTETRKLMKEIGVYKVYLLQEERIERLHRSAVEKLFLKFSLLYRPVCAELKKKN